MFSVLVFYVFVQNVVCNNESESSNIFRVVQGPYEGGRYHPADLRSYNLPPSLYTLNDEQEEYQQTKNVNEEDMLGESPGIESEQEKMLKYWLRKMFRSSPSKQNRKSNDEATETLTTDEPATTTESETTTESPTTTSEEVATTSPLVSPKSGRRIVDWVNDNFNFRKSTTRAPRKKKPQSSASSKNNQEFDNLMAILVQINNNLVKLNENLMESLNVNREFVSRQRLNQYIDEEVSDQSDDDVYDHVPRNKRNKRALQGETNATGEVIDKHNTMSPVDVPNSNNGVRNKNTAFIKTTGDPEFDVNNQYGNVNKTAADDSNETDYLFIKNDTNNNTADVNVLAKNVNVSGRRFNTPYVDTGRTKYKLMTYINYNLKELKLKLAPLANVKSIYNTDKAFKLGYIAASLDTLERNLDVLKAKMTANSNILDESKILELFERVSLSNRVVGNLMEALKLFAETRGFPPQIL